MCKFLVEILESVDQPSNRFIFVIALMKLINQGDYNSSYCSYNSTYSSYSSYNSSYYKQNSYYSQFSDQYDSILKYVVYDKSADISKILPANQQ